MRMRYFTVHLLPRRIACIPQVLKYSFLSQKIGATFTWLLFLLDRYGLLITKSSPHPSQPNVIPSPAEVGQNKLSPTQEKLSGPHPTPFPHAMLITICYSVLTWMQSRQRSEIQVWVNEYLLPPPEGGPGPSSCSLVFIRGEAIPEKNNSAGVQEPSDDHFPERERPASASSCYYSTRNGGRDSVYSSAWSMDSRCSSVYSTPRHQPATPTTDYPPPPPPLAPDLPPQAKFLKTQQSFESAGNSVLISPLSFNHCSVMLRRLLWVEEGARALAISPRQIVELHDWTAFSSTGSESNPGSFRILMEAEPGLVKRHQYRKFSSFGSVVAWRWCPDLALILEVISSTQLVELMHIFRLGNIVLEGGWRVYRITTISTEGAVGTLISRPALDPYCSSPLEKFHHLLLNNLTPAELRRLSSATGGSSCNFSPSTSSSSIHSVYRPSSASAVPIPPTGIFERVSNLSNHTSKHDITTIAEEGGERGIGSSGESINSSTTTGALSTNKPLLNWYERSPRKRSIANLPNFEKPGTSHTVPRRRSFCPGILSSSTSKSSSLASLLFKTPSISVDEQDEENADEVTAPLTKRRSSGGGGGVVTSKSHDSLSSVAKSGLTPSTATPPKQLALLTASGSSSSLAWSSSPRRSNIMPGRSPPGKRVGKPPNILILCDDAEKREEIGKILKGMLPNDRYAIYDIRWDQLAVGGWSEQTALLVLSGHIPLDVDSPSPSGTSLLLQFLGDGGRLLAWACDSAPFGPNNSVGTTNSSSTNDNKHILEYGVGPSSSTKVTPRPLPLTRSLWPHNFPKIVETSDSEGYSRPLTASVYAKLRDASGVGAVLNLDGGALGGKAVLSQIEFEKCSEEEGALNLLSTLLNNLGLDCSRSKDPDYTFGYLLGDHKKVQDFLSAVPPTLKQSELTLEFTPRGGKGSQPSHTLFPIHTLECPTNFSTLDYYENLETKDLGRLIVYTDTLTSTTHFFGGPSIQHGLVVIARRQTSGRGRGRNVWLSPEGCAMFSLQLVISMDSALGRRLSLAQHLAALSVILAVPNHKEIDLRVKWPNDIYIGEQKVGGVLVDSRLEGKRAVINMGIGVNVSNAYPTVCLNSALFPDFRSESNGDATKGKSTKEPPAKKNKAHWTTEKLVARTLTEIEKLIESLEKHEGLEDFLQLYEDNWIHHSSQNTLPPEEKDAETDLSLVSVEISPGAFTLCRIAGIDEYGFLRVIDSSSGSMFSVRPDGNSFDIANRLIALKPD